MGFGSNEAVQNAEQDYREEMELLVAEMAARLIAARTHTRGHALKAAREYYENDENAMLDTTGTAELSSNDPTEGLPPVKNPAQIRAIKESLLDCGFDVSDPFE